MWTGGYPSVMENASGEVETCRPEALSLTEDQGGDDAKVADISSAGWPEQWQVVQAQLRAKEAEVVALKQKLKAIMPTSPSKWMPCESHAKPVSIVIPMGGLGGAFAEAGFRMPKPLVNVVGRPVLLWLLDNLSLSPEDLVLCAVPAAMERQYGIAKLLSRELPGKDVRVITLPFETRGWVETVLAVVRQMTPKELRRPLVTLDCSTIYHGVDLLARCRAMQDQNENSASVYFDVEGVAALTATGSVASQFSYLRLGEHGEIREVKEKVKISSYANAGSYIFRTSREFRFAAEALLEKPEEAAKGGLYASSLMTWMMERGERFEGIQVQYNEFSMVASPPQLETFICKVSSGSIPMSRAMRFCFDLDGTLVTQKGYADGVPSCEPIPQAIALVRQLHAAGHTIIVTTSRGMTTSGSVGSAVASVGRQTIQLLTELDIPYDELHFGKPHADIYVDSHSLNSQGDVEQDLGWHVNPRGSDGHMALEGAIDARSFNLVRSAGKAHVIKSSTPDVLMGECHWYRCIPPPLANFFPKPLEIIDGDPTDEAALSTITMAKIQGVTFSHLVTGRLLMNEWLRRLVRALHSIHAQEPPKDSQTALEQRATNAEICANYATKVKKRTAQHIALYDSLAEECAMDTRAMASLIVGFLEEFETTESAQHAYYIHGDPVFSNVLRTAEDQIVLIDMRGQIGNRITTQGDVHYDLSKLYQSLCGYDFMLLDQSLDEGTSETLDGLRATFWEEIRVLYPKVSHRHVRLLTAANFFTIVPLHEVRSRMVRYLRTAHSMLHVEGLM
ncbi:unnamed protein product [Polarella glacialis]|uniref:Nucleotidyl transferase domain-containing protein n=1 Tax=Polarella glacialis TaxID=89957 RepID=A0A813FLM0_POLGL|nr:unnamed protein product [Polarella glacialis]CAE8611270.1 unnamed protein product [Polarella glacialis]